MNKKKMILTSLASVAILGAGFVASQPTFVRAEEAPEASQSKAEKDYDAAMEKIKLLRKNTKTTDAKSFSKKQKLLRKNMKTIRRKLKRKQRKQKKLLKRNRGSSNPRLYKNCSRNHNESGEKQRD